MSTHSKNNSGKRGITVLGKRFFLVIGILALVVFFIALGAAFIPQGGHENKPSAVTLFGTGTVSDPYQIGSVEDLAELADDVNINGNFHTGDWFILTADLDLNVSPYNDTGWTPIGHDDTNSSRFEGNFNGNGHTISNLYINDTSNDNIGLFGLVWNGTIENLGVLNADVTGDVVVGGAVGSAYYSTIENCYVTGKVTGEGSVGGVVGTGLMSTIKNCYNAGAVTGDGDCVGGILGVNSGVVENCYNIGDVYGGNVSVGGVVGYNDSNSIVDNCYNIGDVAGKGQSEGGVAGTNYGTIDYCYNTGAVNVNYGSYAGGVVADNFGTVENSYNVGAVYCVGNDVGGAVGWNETDGTIEKCFNTGDVRCSGSEVGGVAGFNDGTVQKCYNTCNVTTIGSRSDVGGVVGGNRGMVENCYNKGDIPNTGTYVGGVAGYNGSGGTIGNCYNIGAVNGDGSNVGGVVGSNSGFGTVENCFFKRESGVFNSSLHGIGNTGSDTGAEPTSDADMQKMSTFTTGTGLTNGSWDIDSIGGSSPVWFMLDSETYPNPTYPMLFWQIADSGSGTETDQYVITTVQQLENIQNVFVMHKESSGVYWQLGKDIDLTGYLAEGGPGYNGGFGWVPIGSSNTYSFIGNFDGSGHTITGLFINSGYYYVGPFGYVYSGCEIMNLGVVNANITGGFYVGGVVGYNNGGTVESCYVTGTVYGSGSDVGGIAGYASGTEENCYNTSTVTGRGNAVGGVAGYIYGTVENCYNTGAVTITVMGSDVGGVVGTNIGKIENCYNTGAVTLIGSGILAGGVAGYANGTVENCFFLWESGGINDGLFGIGNTGLNTGAEPTSDIDMQKLSTFTTGAGLTAGSWDFDNVWGIYLNNNNPGEPDYGFPYIKTIKNNVLVIPDGGSIDFDGNHAPIPTWTSKDPFDIGLFTGSLSYDPMPAIDAGTYKITLGTLDSPFYQVRFQDDVRFEIVGASPPPSPGVSYTITATSDANSVISPSGEVSVPGGSNRTFTYSANAGYHISSVTVNGNDLAQDQITGSFTFANVLFNNTIDVKSAPGSPITLTITIAQGSGHAEYSVNGSDFAKFVSPVQLNASDDVTVRAIGGDGYSFVKWETPSTETSSEITFQSVTSSLSLKAFFSESGTSAGGGNSCLCWWILIVIIVLIIIGIIIWYLYKKKKEDQERS